MINLNCPSQTTRAVFLGDNMNHFSYKPSGVCSQKIDFDIDSIDPIPISKTYEQAVLARFNSR